MEKFNKVTDPKELEFFSIDPDGKGGKEIHIMGYIYASDTNLGEGFWRNVEFSFCIIPLKEFIKNLADDEDYINRSSTTSRARLSSTLAIARKKRL